MASTKPAVSVSAVASVRRRTPDFTAGICGKALEVRAGIEPAFADLQSDASPLCHRTPVAAAKAEATHHAACSQRRSYIRVPGVNPDEPDHSLHKVNKWRERSGSCRPASLDKKP